RAPGAIQVPARNPLRHGAEDLDRQDPEARAPRAGEVGGGDRKLRPRAAPPTGGRRAAAWRRGVPEEGAARGAGWARGAGRTKRPVQSRSMLPEQKSRIADALRSAAQRLVAQAGVAAEVPPVTLDRPKQPEHGDLASNLALQLARAL